MSQLYIFLTDCHLDMIMGKNRSQGQKWNLLQLCYASMMIRSVVWRKQRTWQRNVPRAHLLFILRLMFNVGFVYACFFMHIYRLSDWIVIVLFFNPSDSEYSWRWKGITYRTNGDCDDVWGHYYCQQGQPKSNILPDVHTHTRLLNTGSEYLLFCIDLPLHRLADLQNCFIFVWSGYSDVYNYRKMWMNDTCLLVWIDALDKTEACFDGFTHLRVSFFCHCQCSVAILMELEKTKQSNYIKSSQPK